MQNLKKWGSLVVLGLALAIIIIDTTLLNVSLSTIIREFHTTIQSIQWVITAYSLMLAAFTITGGRIGDLFGRKRMFVVGAVIFAIGSFTASISHSVPTLLIGESIIEGIGAALMMPATASLLIANFHGKERGIAFGVWGGIAGASSAIGPILGGYLTNNYSWRWGFRINVFVAALLVIGSIIVKESHDTKEKPNLDFVGVALSALGMLGVVFGVIESSTYGWIHASQAFTLLGHTFVKNGLSFVPFSILAGLIFLILFFIWEAYVERKGNTPLVSLSLFKNRVFTSGVVTTAIVSLGQVGLIFALPVFLQSVLKLDAFQTGLAMLPLSLALLIMAPVSGFLSHKISPKILVIAGLFLDIVAMFLLRSSLSVWASTSDLILPLALYGAGMGLVMAQISNLTLSSVPVYQAGEASGVNNTLRQVGSTLGSAVIGAVLIASLSTNITKEIENDLFIPDSVKPQLVKVVSQQTSNVEFGGGAQVSSKIPPVIVQQIAAVSKKATVDSAQESMLYAAFFAVLGLIAAFFLPNKHAETRPAGEGAPVAGH
ncbi:MAG TPA: DHA2 family efflux MFS transporter permease subunit [Patescibacteria group bacterium]|nr:DHA2 family efflux MFS transporter permease subunit [Patescibacteria group bacterium]